VGVLNYATEFETLHRQLYSLVDGKIPEELALYVTPTLATYELVPGQFIDYDHFNATVRLSSYMNLGTEMSTRGRRIANLAASAVTDANPDVFFTTYNGIWSVLSASTKAVDLAMLRSSNQGAMISLSNLVMLGVALAMFVIIGGTILVPAAFSVIRAKQHTLDLLLDVPLPVVRALRARAFKHVQEDMAEEAGDDQAAESATGADEAQAIGGDEGLATIVKAAMRKHTGVSQEAGTARRCSCLAGRCGRASSSGDQGRHKSYQRTFANGGPSGRTLLLMAFLLPIVLYAAYFGERWGCYLNCPFVR
jgi:hypothetical protein